MYSTAIFAVILSTALAAPVEQTLPPPHGGQDGIWQPAAGTVATCSTTSDKIISFFVGPQQDTVVEAACYALLPPCANPDHPKDTFCPANSSKPVMWGVADCKGYFTQLVSNAPDKGCFNNMGAGVGSLKVGGDDSFSLKGAIFDLSIVEDK